MTKNRQTRLTDALTEAFTPNHLEVRDESILHQGHAGARPEGETHYRVKISARHFDGMTRVAQHRAVMAAVDDEFKTGLHALAIEIIPRDAEITPQVLTPKG